MLFLNYTVLTEIIEFINHTTKNSQKINKLCVKKMHQTSLSLLHSHGFSV